MALLAEPKLPLQRLSLLRYAVVVIFVLLLIGFWQLQVVRSDYYANLAERNRIRTLPVMAPRGLIVDREGRPRLARHQDAGSAPAVRQLRLFAGEDEQVVEDLKRTDVDRLTPLQALALLAELKKRLGS